MYKAELLKFFQKFSIHLKISGTRNVTRSKFHTDSPQILGAPPGARDLSTTNTTYFPDRLNLINIWTWTVLWDYILNFWFMLKEFETNNIHYTTLSLNFKARDSPHGNQFWCYGYNKEGKCIYNINTNKLRTKRRKFLTWH